MVMVMISVAFGMIAGLAVVLWLALGRLAKLERRIEALEVPRVGLNRITDGGVIDAGSGPDPSSILIRAQRPKSHFSREVHPDPNNILKG